MDLHKLFLRKSSDDLNLEDLSQHLNDLMNTLLSNDLYFESQIVNALSILIHRRLTIKKEGYTDELKEYVNKSNLNFEEIDLEIEPIEALFFVEAIKPGRMQFDTGELLIKLLGAYFMGKSYKNGRDVLEALYNILFQRNESQIENYDLTQLDSCSNAEIEEYKKSKKVVFEYLQVDATPFDLELVQN